MRHNGFLPLCLAVILVWWCIPVYAQDLPTGGKTETITLGVSAKHVLNLPIYLAQKYGIFETEGIDL